jgi:hypothetical protein
MDESFKLRDLVASAIMCWTSRSKTEMKTRSTFSRKAANWAKDVNVLFVVPKTRVSAPSAVAGRELALEFEGNEPSEMGGVSVVPEAAEKGNPSVAAGSQDETVPGRGGGW